MFLKSRGIGRSLLWRQSYHIYQPPVKRLSKNMDLLTAYKSGLMVHPLSFEERCMIINDPKTIAYLEVVEYGITFKPTRKMPLIVFVVGAVIATSLYLGVPTTISERYFTVSQQSPQHTFSYFSSVFVFSSLGKLALFVPGILAMLYTTRYFKDFDYLLMIALACLGNYTLGQPFVQRRIQSFKEWEMFKFTTGEDFVILVMGALLSFRAKSIKDLLVNPSLRLLFETMPGMGVTSKGVAVLAPFLLYMVLEGYRAWQGEKPWELVLYYAVVGTVYGLARRSLVKK